MQEFAKILSNVEIAKDIWKMELKTDLAKIAKPGQFIEITVPGFYLRRPISISEIKEDILVIIYKVLGEGTLKMTELEGKLDIFGPLGNGFPIEDKEEVLLIGGGVKHIFEQACEGIIAKETHGNNGFGYDPIFMVGQKSFAELSSEEKNEISHRGKAVKKLVDYLKNEK